MNTRHCSFSKPQLRFGTLQRRLTIVVGAMLAGLALSTLTQEARAAAVDPEISRTLRSLTARQREQVTLSKKYSVFHGFQFTNDLVASGITFDHKIVDDCGRDLKAIIYDHGNGLAVADVDGDGKLDIYFVNQLGSSELWRNLGGGKFQNITESAGVGLKERISVSASFADVDNDGRPDLFVTTVRGGNVLFKNLGNGKFEDVSKSAGLDYFGHSSGSVFFDFDNDGLLDLFVCNVGKYTTDKKGRGGYYIGVADIGMSFVDPKHNEQSILYKNMGSLKFKDVSKEMNLQHSAWSGDASACDLNGDGFMDLYVMNMQGENKLYENQGGKSFVDKTHTYFPKTPWGAMGIKFFDYNQDGRLDVYLTDMHSDMTSMQTKAGVRNLQIAFEKDKSDAYCAQSFDPALFKSATNSIFGNAFYQNLGGGKYAEVSDKIGVETYWPWGVSAGDLNADGYDDLFVTSGMGYPFRYSINSVLLNEGGTRFVDSEFLVNVEPRAGRVIDKDYFMLDCSGEDKNNPNCAFKNGPVAIRGVLASRSSAIFDLDDDGDLDIVVADFNGPPMIQINNLTSKKAVHFAKIKLVGATSNRDGLGAVVKVKAGGRTFTQVNDGKSGYLSQSVMPLYFGLGDATQVESVEVTWPSGTKQSVTTGLGTNRQIEIKEQKN
ncbi:MAG: CRTAC1 family protein [Opitutaceae bacterium]|nr:CRTAC1 family protein [Verrucomicrobiales bacterium]